MIEVEHLLADSDRYAAALAQLRRTYADNDHVDPHSTVEPIPTSDDVLRALRDADGAFVAYADSRDLAGYGLARSWVEDDGTTLHLLDAWAVPGPSREAVLTELFITLETFVRDSVSPAADVFLGANSRSSESARVALLGRLGFYPVFAMVEMQSSTSKPEPAALPPDVVLRTVTRDDASAITALTERVWSGRPFFTMPDLEETSRWLARVDADLFLLAEYESQLIGLASAKIGAQCAEIDDVQVDPTWQRRGVATALVRELVVRLMDRTAQPIRLHTEAHDPAGARSLYERLGFVVVTTHHRYRKQLG